jgi:hypothetical protein
MLNPLQTAHGLALVSDMPIHLERLNAGTRADDATTGLRPWPEFTGDRA